MLKTVHLFVPSSARILKYEKYFLVRFLCLQTRMKLKLLHDKNFVMWLRNEPNYL